MVSTEAPPPMSGLLSGSLDSARERGFVGRTREVRAFADSLSGASDFRVHFIYGPGGIGKTTLLDAMARHATRGNARTTYVDARDVACSATAVTAMIAERSGGQESDVLLIDGYELLEPLDRWFREEMLPSRPVGSVTVVAGRSAPPPGWWLDPGWRHLAQVHELSELDGAESDELLVRLGVANESREAMTRLGHGHPLVLAMLAEASRGGTVLRELTDAPDVVGQLCRLIVDDVPDAAHRAGLATCAHATRMTEDLLSRAVRARAGEVWGWLESRPYVRRGAIGLFLHDVVRELFEAEFAQRAPDAYVALHVAVRGYFLERLGDPSEPHPDRAAAEILLLHRRGPLAAESETLRRGGLLPISRAEPEDHDGILAMIEEGEGRESADLARRWIQEQPRCLYRVRSDTGVEAFSMQIYLPEIGDLLTDDPVVAAVRAAVEANGPLRPGERVHINRFAGASGDYQRDPMLLLVNGVACILEWAHQAAAWTFITTFDGEHYGPYFEYLGMAPLVRLEYFGHEMVGHGWDRRRFPTPALFELMARRELTGEIAPPPDELLRPTPLSRPAFTGAVRTALLQLSVPDRLADSALMGTALVDPSVADPVGRLRETLLFLIAGLGSERRGAEHRRVLERTYLKGAPSQEAAAELLGLPFSTYRRHLTQAHDRLVEVLWSIEIGERPLPALDPQEVSSN